jgi:hypothetical protein
MTDDDGGALFPVEAVPRGGPGPAEAALRVAVTAATEAGRLDPEVDGPLAAAALVAARALDNADRVGGLKGGYLVAQSLTGYRECLHALRLPTAIAPGGVPLPKPQNGHTDLSELLGDSFGTPE